MSETVRIYVRIRFNRASIEGLKIMAQSLAEHPEPDEAAIQRLRETISIQEKLLAKGQTRGL